MCVACGSVHSTGLCNRLLRAHYREAGLPQTFQILDSADQLAVVKRLLKNLNIDDEKYPPRELCHFINAHKEQGIRAGAGRGVRQLHTEAGRDLRRVRGAMQSRGGGGLCRIATALLRIAAAQRTVAARITSSASAHILVDEFQDTNVLQYAWLKLLAGGGAERFCGGRRRPVDLPLPWRRGRQHARIRARVSPGRTSSAWSRTTARTATSSTAANAIIKNNRERLGKNLWTDAGEGEPIRAFEAYSDLDEARFVVEEIRELVRDGVPPTRDRHALPLQRAIAGLEDELFTKGVPYKVYGGLRFFERQEIKHALAYLRLLGNPDDDTAFLRVVNFPTRGIGARSLENLQATAHQMQFQPVQRRRLADRQGRPDGGRLHPADRGAAPAKPANLPLPEMVEHVIEKSGLAQHYRLEKEGQERLENLDELINAAATFVDDEGAIGRRRRAGLLPCTLPRWRPASTRPARARRRCN